MYDEDVATSTLVLTAASTTLINFNIIPDTIAGVLIAAVLITIALRIRRRRRNAR